MKKYQSVWQKNLIKCSIKGRENWQKAILDNNDSKILMTKTLKRSNHVKWTDYKDFIMIIKLSREAFIARTTYLQRHQPSKKSEELEVAPNSLVDKWHLMIFPTKNTVAYSSWGEGLSLLKIHKSVKPQNNVNKLFVLFLAYIPLEVDFFVPSSLFDKILAPFLLIAMYHASLVVHR